MECVGSCEDGNVRYKDYCCCDGEWKIAGAEGGYMFITVYYLDQGTNLNISNEERSRIPNCSEVGM